MSMYIGITAKMLVGALGIFILLRLLGKKAISELTPFDLIYVVILGALVEESIYDHHVSIFHVIYAIALWGIVVFIIEKILEKTDKLSSLLQGEPSVLIEKGKLNLQELDNNFLDMEQLRAMLRQHGCHSIAEAYYAILEVNGALTVIPKEHETIPTYLLIEAGNIKDSTLRYIGKDKDWLKAELKNRGYATIEDIIYCEWHEDKQELTIEPLENTIRKKIYLDD